jgi:hypothetical protein
LVSSLLSPLFWLIITRTQFSPPSLRPDKAPPSLPPALSLSIDRIAIRQAHALAELTRVVIPQLAIEGRDALHVLFGELKVEEGEILLQKGRERGREG